MEKLTNTTGASKPMAAFVAAALALSVAFPAQELTAEQAYAADAKPHITMISDSTIDTQVGKKINLKKMARVTKGAKITYTSSKKSIATVSSKGVVTAKKAGKVTIVIKAKKGSKTTTKKVTVEVAKPETAMNSEPAPTVAEKPTQTTQPSPKTVVPEIEIINPTTEPISDPQVEVVDSTSEVYSTSTTVTYEAPAMSRSATTGSASVSANNSSQSVTSTASVVKNGFVTENGNTYYYKNNVKTFGWITVNGSKYYANTSTGIVASGWLRLSDGDRYFDPKAGGKMVTGRFLVPSSGGNNWYYFDANGVRLANVLKDGYYYRASDGVMIANAWQHFNEGDRYFKSDGKMATGRFKVAHTGGSNWYYFDANGVRLANVLKDGYYYRTSDGVMIANAWHHFNDGDRFFKSDGSMAKGVYTVNLNGGSNTYYFNSNGIRMANTITGGYYFRDGDGVGFKIAKISSGTYEILSALGGDQRLDVAAGALGDMANVQTYVKTSTDAQVWRVTPVGSDYYTIVNVNSGKALDVQGGGKANGTNVFQYTANGSDAQKWMPLSYAGGVVLVNKASGKALDIAGAVRGNGANVQSFEMNWTTAQVWNLSPQDPYPLRTIFNTVYPTKEERDTALSIWNSYNEFRAKKGVPQVTWSDECARIALETCYAESKIGKMQHEIAIPVNLRNTYSDILQYSTWRKAGPEAIDRWDKSEGHHRMMRNDHGTTQAGVGVYFDGSKWWYTIVYNFVGRNQYEGPIW